MEEHQKLTDDEFLDLFNSCTLKPELFTHEAHLRLAYLQLRRLSKAIAELTIKSQLKNYVSHVGAVSKYHETMTVAAINAVYHFMQKSSTNNFNEFIVEFPRLKSHFKEVMDQHYSYNIFLSDVARAEYVEPDLLTFE